MAVSRDDLLLSLAAMCEDGQQRRVRGVAVATALEWLNVLPEGAARDVLIEELLRLAERGCRLLAA